jgi:ABC-type amino acid transport system permease subunit
MPRNTSRIPRATLVLAAVTGILSGAARAVTSWLLERFMASS